jgi:hypothetical protein
MDDACLDLKLEALDLDSEVPECTVSSWLLPNIDVIYLWNAPRGCTCIPWASRILRLLGLVIRLSAVRLLRGLPWKWSGLTCRDVVEFDCGAVVSSGGDGVTELGVRIGERS